MKDEYGQIHTSLFRKKTAGNTILRAESSHPRPLVQSIPYSEYLRLKRNCSQEVDFKTEAKALRDRLLLRGYSRKCLKKAYNKAVAKDRIDLLYKNETKEKTVDFKDEGLRLITTFSDNHKD